jgi:hypothetical protein
MECGTNSEFQKDEREDNVTRNIFKSMTFVGFAACFAFVISACNNPPEQVPVVQPVVQQPVVVQPVVQQPVVQPVVAPPPATPLVPIAEEPAAATGKAGTGGGGVDKAIAGPATTGDELVGNYMCQITSKEFPFGLNPPASGCRIYKAGDGSLKIGPVGRQAGISGSINDPKATGYFVVGTYNLSAVKLDIKARMLRKGTNEFSGKGRGVLNGDKANQINYTLTMTQQ